MDILFMVVVQFIKHSIGCEQGAIMNKGCVLVMMSSGLVDGVAWFANATLAQEHLVAVALTDGWIKEKTGDLDNDIAAVCEYCEHTQHAFSIEGLLEPKVSGPFIVLETWPDAQGANICVKEGTGENLVFENEMDAHEYADKECQDGKVVPL